MQTATKTPTCKCGVKDWRKLRKGLVLTQDRMAAGLGMSRRGYQYLEDAIPHRCPQSRATLLVLFQFVQDPKTRRMLGLAGVEIPNVAI